MELLALFMYLFVSEPSVLFYKAFGESVSQQSESIGWGLGFRVRIPVGAHDALRIRLDGRRFAANEALSSSSEAELHTGVSLDYLWRGRNWESGWYAGLGAGWLHREQPMLAQETVTTDAVNGSVILGRAQKLGNGQVALETRLDVAGFEGKVAPAWAISLAYRYHFKGL